MSAKWVDLLRAKLCSKRYWFNTRRRFKMCFGLNCAINTINNEYSLRMEKSIQRWKYKLSKKNKLENYTKYLTFTVFLSTRGYKWRIFRDAWLNTGGVTLGWTDVSSRGGGDSNAPSRFMLKGNHNKLWLDGSLGLTLYTLTSVCIFSTLFLYIS